MTNRSAAPLLLAMLLAAPATAAAPRTAKARGGTIASPLAVRALAGTAVPVDALFAAQMRDADAAGRAALVQRAVQAGYDRLQDAKEFPLAELSAERRAQLAEALEAEQAKLDFLLTDPAASQALALHPQWTPDDVATLRGTIRSQISVAAAHEIKRQIEAEGRDQEDVGDPLVHDYLTLNSNAAGHVAPFTESKGGTKAALLTLRRIASDLSVPGKKTRKAVEGGFDGIDWNLDSIEDGAQRQSAQAATLGAVARYARSGAVKSKALARLRAARRAGSEAAAKTLAALRPEGRRRALIRAAMTLAAIGIAVILLGLLATLGPAAAATGVVAAADPSVSVIALGSLSGLMAITSIKEQPRVFAVLASVWALNALLAAALLWGPIGFFATLVAIAAAVSVPLLVKPGGLAKSIMGIVLSAALVVVMAAVLLFILSTFGPAFAATTAMTPAASIEAVASISFFLSSMAAAVFKGAARRWLLGIALAALAAVLVVAGSGAALTYGLIAGVLAGIVLGAKAFYNFLARSYGQASAVAIIALIVAMLTFVTGS